MKLQSTILALSCSLSLIACDIQKEACFPFEPHLPTGQDFEIIGEEITDPLTEVLDEVFGTEDIDGDWS